MLRILMGNNLSIRGWKWRVRVGKLEYLLLRD